MKYSKSLLALLSLPFYLAAAQDPYQRLTELAKAGNGLIKLDSNTFDLLTSPKRTWSVSVQLTALDKRRKCGPCKEFDPSWNAVAEAWATVPKEHRNEHFFATLDFDDGQATFQKLGLQSAPVVYVYPAAQGPRAPTNGKVSPIKYDFSNGFDAKPLAENLSKHTPIPIPYSDPIDWARYFTMATAVLCLLVTLRFIAPILQSRWTWALVTIAVSLVMTSGYMFTRIRGSPHTGGGGNWIASGFQNQFGQEVSVVAGIYGLLAMSFLMLILVVPYQTSPARQRVQIYLWSGVFVIVYSVLVSLFRVKNRGYPFKLFL
ncbi:oligosaccharyl transferase subunit OST3/OST6 family [Lyophyllum atratum]|nr:oligosaccharyl transferase subunit OST3/OST6 family [Lyophyllum atratum]